MQNKSKSVEQNQYANQLNQPILQHTNKNKALYEQGFIKLLGGSGEFISHYN